MSFTKSILTIASPAFTYNGYIPSTYTHDGKNINPPLSVKDIPDGTKSLVLIIEDRGPEEIVNLWLVWNIPPAEIIKEGHVPGTLGKNSLGKTDYAGPAPAEGVHRYFFKVYALDAKLELKEDSEIIELEKAMKGHILSSGELIGLYRKMD